MLGELRYVGLLHFVTARVGKRYLQFLLAGIILLIQV